MTEIIEQSKDQVRVELRGTILSITKGKSLTQNVPYANILFQVKKKYTETIPGVIYGDAVELLTAKLQEGDRVVAEGRLRSKTKQDKLIVSLVIDQLDKIQ